MSKVSEYISSLIRKHEDSLVPLREEHRKIGDKITAIESELRDLYQAGKAIGLVTGLPRRTVELTRKQQPEKTIKEAAVDVLADYPNGLLALDLLAKINQRFGWTLVRSSLSPQLSRLKSEGKIRSEGSTWLLPREPTLFLDTDKKHK